jgi:hypothetical protein
MILEKLMEILTDAITFTSDLLTTLLIVIVFIAGIVSIYEFIKKHFHKWLIWNQSSDTDTNIKAIGESIEYIKRNIRGMYDSKQDS